MITLAVGLTALLLFGFVLFAVSASHEPDRAPPRSDAIVVLTGAGNRITVGGRLLAERRAGRLLISGVNRKTSLADVFRLARLERETFRCCVELGYEAQDTVGNAVETQKWVRRLGIRRLIVVTSSYHMPRSLTELRGALPDTELIPYPVVPPSLKLKPWWLSYTTTRTLLAEYLKLLPAAARFAAARVLKPFSGSHETANVDISSR
ncbi:MAG: putative exported protein [Pseudomonadota bacterium]